MFGLLAVGALVLKEFKESEQGEHKEHHVFDFWLLFCAHRVFISQNSRDSLKRSLELRHKSEQTEHKYIDIC